MKAKLKSSKQQNIRLGSNFLEISRSSTAGQALVEAIVALSVLMIGYVAILGLLNNSLATSSLVSNQDIATYLASEGIEVVKNLVDANLLSGELFDYNFVPGSYQVTFDQKLVSPPDENPGLRIGGPGDLSSTPLNFDSDSKSYTYASNINTAPTRFKRTIQIKKNNNQMHVISIVQWETKNGGSAEVKLEDFFFPQN